MATHRYVDFDIDEAKTLADLNGIRFDLDTVIEMCHELVKYLDDASFNSTVLDALGHALIVRYFRCFGYGVRDKLDESMFENLDEDEKNFHNALKDLRDKHIAHSVNSFEENYVVVYLNPEERGKKINSVSVQHHRMIAVGEDTVVMLETIAKKLIVVVKTMIDDEKEKILELARKENINDMYARDSKTIIPGDWSAVSKRRKR